MAADAPFHAHIYYSPGERSAAEVLRGELERWPDIRFVGRMMDEPVGPHPVAQYEVHFERSARDSVAAAIARSGLRALIHPLTNDDLADHTESAEWIGEPIALDLRVLDPPGVNQGLARFGNSDF